MQICHTQNYEHMNQTVKQNFRFSIIVIETFLINKKKNKTRNNNQNKYEYIN